MKVNIGPYKNWFGPYHLSRHLGKLGFSDKFAERMGDYIPQGPFQWWDNLFKRKVDVTIHEYDTWSMDHTLAHIVLPMLKQLKKTKHGSPFIDNVDVPDELKSTAAPPTENEWDTDELWEKRWDWVLDEMINSFECIKDEETNPNSWEDKYFRNPDGTPKEFDRDGYAIEAARIAKGFELFGKYFQALWD